MEQALLSREGFPMNARLSGRLTLWFATITLAVSTAGSAVAGQDAADLKLLTRLVQEIPLVASLYDKNDEPVKVESLPKYPAKKVAPFTFSEKEAAALEFKRFQANRPKYANQFPLRAAIFEAVDIMDNLKALKMPMTLRADEATPKGKVVFLRQQGNVGLFIFKLEKAFDQMLEVEEKGAKGATKRWQAHLEFAQARVLSNLLFLYEYNFTLGQVRADNLPALGKGQNGWIIAARPKIAVTEGKAKAYAKDRLKRLKKIQDDYAETPWAYFADRETRRDVGMEWVVKKK